VCRAARLIAGPSISASGFAFWEAGGATSATSGFIASAFQGANPHQAIAPVATSRYHECMAKQTTVRLPDDLAHEAEAVARVRGTSVNALIVDSLSAEVARVRSDKDFVARARKLLERDKELLDRLAR
jgi:4-aminobutyrate aminotransferase-like enzyme